MSHAFRYAGLRAWAPHAGAHSFDDQAAFQLSDGADDDNNRPAQWVAGVDLLSEADVFDVDSAMKSRARDTKSTAPATVSATVEKRIAPLRGLSY